MDTCRILGDDVAVAVAATGCTSCRLDGGMIAGNGIMAGCATELGMSGMTKLFWIDIILAADLCLISVACDAGFVFTCAVTKGIIGGPRLIASCKAEHNERHDDNATLRNK